jgi:hypothetical protein
MPRLPHSSITQSSLWKVPVYVGEFQSYGIWEYALEAYNEAEVSWTVWTYKGVKSTYEGWFIYRNLNAPLVNPEKDSYQDILEKWSMIGTDAEGFTEDGALLEVLKRYV